MSTAQLELLMPEWPVAARVRACTTLRAGGVSEGPYATLNLAHHVGDRADHVAENRRRLRTALGLPAEPMWLAQVHGAAVARPGDGRNGAPADAAVASALGEVCAVLTADCLPVVLADRDATRVAVAHAGWRGLAAGVLEATLEALDQPPERLIAWLGPAISQPAFEVGEEVRAAFLARSPEYAGAFAGNPRGRFQADLYALARITLTRAGVMSVHGGGWCTASDPVRFFSYRRDGTTGRMATLAWLA
jgi:YfiH family protein